MANNTTNAQAQAQAQGNQPAQAQATDKPVISTTLYAQALAKAGAKPADKAQAGDKVTYTATARCVLLKAQGKTVIESWRRKGKVRLYVPTDSAQAVVKAGGYNPEKAPTGYTNASTSVYVNVADFATVAPVLVGIAQATADKAQGDSQPADSTQATDSTQAQATDSQPAQAGDSAQATDSQPTGDKPADSQPDKPAQGDKATGDKPKRNSKRK